MCKHVRFHRQTLWITLLALALAHGGSTPAAGDAIERMQLDRLKATQQAVEQLRDEWQEVKHSTDYTDYRAAIHVHSHLSHDSNASVEEICRGANAAGVDVIVFTEHPSDQYDFIRDGHRGVVDGVLLVPGAEAKGLLALPQRSIQNEPAETPQQFADLVRQADGLAFLSHVESKLDWQIHGLAGSEIYNTHADFLDETALLAKLRQPTGILSLIPVLEQYPQGIFAALLDYPAEYLRKYDELCQQAPHTGVAANDSHHNQGVRGIVTDEGKLRIEDALGKTITVLDPEKIPLIKRLIGDHKAGETVLDVDLDPYQRSFRHVSTHLLMKERSEVEVRQALASGRAYVAFDWMADPNGFFFEASAGGKTWPVGSELSWTKGITLRAAAPLPCFYRVIRDGRQVHQSLGRQLELQVDEPGVYRVEAWLNLADERRIWILSNPIYLRSP